MKFIRGSIDRVHECGGNYYHWVDVSDADIAAHPGAVREPKPSAYSARCHVVREIAPNGSIVDCRVRALHVELGWDESADKYMIVPSNPDNRIDIEPLSFWFNIYCKVNGFCQRERSLRGSVVKILWRNATRLASNTDRLLQFIREWAAKNNKVLGVCEEDTLCNY